jgi:hypothetical protein
MCKIKKFVVIVVIFLSSGIAYSQNEMPLTISKNGIEGLIEIGMSLSDLQKKGLDINKSENTDMLPNLEHYQIDSLGIDFEIYDGSIIRIWFFADKNKLFQLWLPKESSEKLLYKISALDIIRNFGVVSKYVDENPPKDKDEALWAKYKPFGIKINTIYYPKLPFHFGLNDDDNVTYLTVSKCKTETAP